MPGGNARQLGRCGCLILLAAAGGCPTESLRHRHRIGPAGNPAIQLITVPSTESPHEPPGWEAVIASPIVLRADGGAELVVAYDGVSAIKPLGIKHRVAPGGEIQ